MDRAQGIFGRGWAFPPQFSMTDEKGGDVAMVQDLEDIYQSLRILFSTMIGERIMRPEFGCDLHGKLFENITPNLVAEVRALIKDSVLKFEPRIQLTAIDVEHDRAVPTKLNIRVSFFVRGSDIQGAIDSSLDMFAGAEVFL